MLQSRKNSLLILVLFSSFIVSLIFTPEIMINTQKSSLAIYNDNNNDNPNIDNRDSNFIPKPAILNEPTLSEEMFPVVLNMGDFSSMASELNGLNYQHIRVLYFSKDYEWISVPFQIDEVGRPYRWENRANPGDTPDPQLYQFDGKTLQVRQVHQVGSVAVGI